MSDLPRDHVPHVHRFGDRWEVTFATEHGTLYIPAQTWSQAMHAALDTATVHWVWHCRRTQPIRAELWRAWGGRW